MIGAGGGNIEVTIYTEPNCDIATVIGCIGACELIIIDSGKLVLAIPYSQNLLQIMDYMEKEKTTLQIRGLGLSLITLDKIFLKYDSDSVFVIYSFLYIIKKDDIFRAATNVRCNINEENIRQITSKESSKVEYNKLVDFDLTKQQIQTLFYKKYIHTIRRPYLLLMTVG